MGHTAEFLSLYPGAGKGMVFGAGGWRLGLAAIISLTRGGGVGGMGWGCHCSSVFAFRKNGCSLEVMGGLMACVYKQLYVK